MFAGLYDVPIEKERLQVITEKIISRNILIGKFTFRFMWFNL